MHRTTQRRALLHGVDPIDASRRGGAKQEAASSPLAPSRRGSGEVAEEPEASRPKSVPAEASADRRCPRPRGMPLHGRPPIRELQARASLLAPRRRIDVALHAVVMQAWVEGVSTRKVDDLVAALGVESGISKSEVSRICAQLDTEVAAWRCRPLGEQAFPYVFCDATYCKARVGGRVVSRAVVIATGVAADGRREVLGCDVGDSENEVLPTEFLRGLRDRGLTGVQLVISDAHRGLTGAIDTVLTGAAWQRSSADIPLDGTFPSVTSA